MPLAIPISPRVATKGGIFIFPMTKPLKKPQIPPIAKPMRQLGMSMPVCSMAMAVITEVSATIDPAPRSMPAVKITSVCPAATMLMTDA